MRGKVLLAALTLVPVASAQWSAPQDLGTSPGFPAGGRWGDVDGDSRVDLVSGSTNSARVQKALANGTFAAPVSYPTPGQPTDLAIGDADGDGRADIVCWTANAGGIAILLANGSGGYANAIHVPGPADHHATGVAIGDLDGDGWPDIVVALGFRILTPFQYLPETKVAVCMGTGPATWGGISYLDLGAAPRQLNLTDLDRDGDRDFVAGTTSSIVIGRNDGSGGFALVTQPQTGDVIDLRVRDVDRDGVDDLVCAVTSAVPGNSVVQVRRGIGGLSYAPPVPYSIGQIPQFLRVADLDGDGLDDVAVASWSQPIGQFLPGIAGGAFGAAVPFATGALGGIESFDHDGDGRLDLVTAGRYLVRNAGTFPPVYAYCTSKLTATGCTPAIGYSGIASVSAPSGFVVDARQVQSQVNGLFFYGLGGPLAKPFQGGTLCIGMPRVRTATQSSGGAPTPGEDCTGTFSIDFNAYLASGNGPPSAHVPGAVVHGQFWSREVGAPPGESSLSDAVRFELQP